MCASVVLPTPGLPDSKRTRRFSSGRLSLDDLEGEDNDDADLVGEVPLLVLVGLPKSGRGGAWV